MRDIWPPLVGNTYFISVTCENILLLDCGSARYSARHVDMYTHREAGLVTAESNIILRAIVWITPTPRVRESSERGESIDQMMYTIDARFYTMEVKVYDVRIAQGQARTRDVVDRNIHGYSEFDSTRGHRSE